MSNTKTTARQWRTRGNRSVLAAAAFAAAYLAVSLPTDGSIGAIGWTLFAVEVVLAMWAVRCYSQAARAEQ